MGEGQVAIQSLPGSPETDRLRMHASGQIMSLGWREGMSAEEATPFYIEALDMARQLKDSFAEVMILTGYGRVMACTGSADKYVSQLQQAIEVCEDPSIRTMLLVFLCQAYGYAGKLREALAAGETALKQVATSRSRSKRSSASTWNDGPRVCTRGFWCGPAVSMLRGRPSPGWSPARTAIPIRRCCSFRIMPESKWPG